MKEKIKEIIYRYSHKGGMCEDFKEGQIIGLKTGEDGELDIVAEAILGLFKKSACNCGEPHISQKIAHHTEKCHVIDKNYKCDYC